MSILLFISFLTAIAAQSTPSVVCVPGQCLQGFSNITIGAKLSASGAATTLHLLPGEYSSNTNPKLLSELLTSSSASLASSPGFPNSAAPLPLNLKLSPGLAIYAGARYSGQSAFSSLPTESLANSSTPITAASLAISENIWVAVGNSNNNERVVLWESVPDVAQLSLPTNLNLLDMQSTTCSPGCSSSGVCNPSGQCVCPPNFSGASCESCAKGFFGPQCTPCPDDCEDCDEGISGSGQCLSPNVGEGDPKNCGCVNGECSPDGTCACNAGWQDGNDGKCSRCETGFFLAESGDCTACQPGCRECADKTAVCGSCRPGFNILPNDNTRCEPTPQVDGGGKFCAADNYSDGVQCQRCDNACDTCAGPGSGACLTCSRDLFMVDGKCVSADANGICSGTDGQVADTIKKICDVCPSRCTTCRIPNFSGTQRLDEVQCTGCLPGSFLSQGKCVEKCPTGTFPNPQDGLTCIACSSSCATCAGSANFCLSCPGSLFASDGECVTTCPAGSFSTTTSTTPPSSGCSKCHPDCASCSGPSFTQCTACPSDRPVLSLPTGSQAGRCLATCNKNQFFDSASKQCLTCDGACSSCTGAGSSKCLSCQSPRQVVRNGQCVDANCSNNSGVIGGLGVCLSELVLVPSGTEGPSPLPTITGLDEPAPKATGGRKLEWWQILLMALGCAFIFVTIIWCWRRRARKQRAKRTELFAKGKGITESNSRWKWATGWWTLWKNRKWGRNGKKANNNRDSELPIAYNHQDVASRDIKMSDLASSKSTKTKTKDKDTTFLAVPSRDRKPRQEDNDDLESYIDAYDYSRRSLSVRSHTPSTLPDIDGYYRSSSKRAQEHRDRLRQQATGSSGSRSARGRERDLERESIYSQMTGETRHTPEPRIPIKRDLRPIRSGGSRRSISSSGSSSRSPSPPPVPFSRNKLVKKQVSFSNVRSNTDGSDEVVISPPKRKQQDGVLVELDSDSDRGGNWASSTSLPLQYTNNSNTTANINNNLINNASGLRQLQILNAMNANAMSAQAQPQVQMPTFQTLTEAQAYAMAVKPQLGTAVTVQPQASGYTLAWVPTHLTGGSSATLNSTSSLMPGGQQQLPMPTFTSLNMVNTGSTFPTPSTTTLGSNNGLYWMNSGNNGGLKPALTGSSTLTNNSLEMSKNPFRKQAGL